MLAVLSNIDLCNDTIHIVLNDRHLRSNTMHVVISNIDIGNDTIHVVLNDRDLRADTMFVY